MIITIAGTPGAGKSTVAKLLTERLGYRFYSTGDLRGQIAVSHGMTIDELNEVGRNEDWPHKECDDLTIQLGSEDDLVIDSWLAWHFIPHSKKFYLSVDPIEAARRVFMNQRPDETPQNSVEDTQKMLASRYELTRDSFLRLYGVDISDKNNYDLVIDTTTITPEQTAETIINHIKQP